MEYSTEEIEHLKAVNHDIGWRRGLVVGIAISAISIIGVLLISCKTTVKETETTEYIMGKPVKIIEYDSCEYVGFNMGNGYRYSHKGNCKFCIARNKR